MPISIEQPGVYKITNILTGDFYIGSSYDIPMRWRGHRASFKKETHPNRSIIHAAVRKYGIDNFIFEVLEETDSDKESLLRAEQFYLDNLRPVYNILPKAGSRLGSKASLETIEKLKGKKHSDEWKAEMSAKMKDYMARDEIRAHFAAVRGTREYKEKFSTSLREFWNSPEGSELSQRLSEKRKGKFNGLVGYKHSPEILKRLSEARKGKKLGRPGWSAGVKLGPHSAEWNEKISKAQKGIPKPHLVGIPRTDEVKQKISETQTGVPKYYSRGKPSGNSRHGHYGLSWRKDLNKWTVRLQDKKYGNFINLEDALHRRDEIMNSPAYIAANEPKSP